MALNNIITREDFTGSYVLAIPAGTFHETNLDEIIAESQETYLRFLLGDKEYAKLLADCVDGEPENPTYWALLYGGIYTDKDGDAVAYSGFAPALKGFAYHSYVRSFGTTQTTSGNMELSGTQGNTARLDGMTKSVRLYNDAVTYYNGPAYNFTYANKADFPQWQFVNLDNLITFIHV
jgi:hypothetical protein